MKKRIVFQYVLRGLLSIICKNTLRVEQDHAPCITDPIIFFPILLKSPSLQGWERVMSGLNMNDARYIDVEIDWKKNREND